MESIRQNVSESRWAGGTAPFAGRARLGIWLLVASDAMTFGALLASAVYLRWTQAADWPRVFDGQALGAVALMTALLLFSGEAMRQAVRAARGNRRPLCVRWTSVASTCGVLFLWLHGAEWRSLTAAGLQLSSNPWGTPVFGAAFFTITGMHMLHVLAGVVWLPIAALGFALGRLREDHLRAAAAYWYFVDAVWLAVVAVVYLLAAK